MIIGAGMHTTHLLFLSVLLRDTGSLFWISCGTKTRELIIEMPSEGDLANVIFTKLEKSDEATLTTQMVMISNRKFGGVS
ncbi:hypothetical protein HYFRA_00005982 [Hymenoscyphus fraxineus]|uniref:Uncharacterized protein n=1 Tax=Hymenoscyphus fraxineus TaxID=746836 RepID=A0A9N9KXE7_9HELO|nr:hypothetical protein HYFRA_00005982 [Hymenoscyphus fraxineus]